MYNVFGDKKNDKGPKLEAPTPMPTSILSDASHEVQSKRWQVCRNIQSIFTKNRRIAQFTKEQWDGRSKECSYFYDTASSLGRSIRYWTDMDGPVRFCYIWGLTSKSKADIFDAAAIEFLASIDSAIKTAGYDHGARIKILMASPHASLNRLPAEEILEYARSIEIILQKYPNTFEVEDLGRYWSIIGLNLNALTELTQIVLAYDLDPKAIFESDELTLAAMNEGLGNIPIVRSLFNQVGIKRLMGVFKASEHEIMLQAERNARRKNALHGAVMYALTRHLESYMLAESEFTKNMIPLIPSSPLSDASTAQGESEAFFCTLFAPGSISVWGIGNGRNIKAPPWKLREGESKIEFSHEETEKYRKMLE